MIIIINNNNNNNNNDYYNNYYYYSDSPSNSDIRLYQSQYISKLIELNNKEFQAPVVMGISLNESPSSMVR
jgi:hypothetical protein